MFEFGIAKVDPGTDGDDGRIWFLITFACGCLAVYRGDNGRQLSRRYKEGCHAVAEESGKLVAVV